MIHNLRKLKQGLYTGFLEKKVSLLIEFLVRFLQ